MNNLYLLAAAGVAAQIVVNAQLRVAASSAVGVVPLAIGVALIGWK